MYFTLFKAAVNVRYQRTTSSSFALSISGTSSMLLLWRCFFLRRFCRLLRALSVRLGTGMLVWLDSSIISGLASSDADSQEAPSVDTSCKRSFLVSPVVGTLSGVSGWSFFNLTYVRDGTRPSMDREKAVNWVFSPCLSDNLAVSSVAGISSSTSWISSNVIGWVLNLAEFLALLSFLVLRTIGLANSGVMCSCDNRSGKCVSQWYMGSLPLMSHPLVWVSSL